MTSFEFDGKTYLPVKDNLMTLIAGCRKCAFFNKPEKCYAVDAAKPWAARCAAQDVHYEEVLGAPVTEGRA